MIEAWSHSFFNDAICSKKKAMKQGHAPQNMGKARYISKLIKDCKTKTTNNISMQKL